MRLVLLRHGQTHGNTAGALDTAVPGLDLTELGVRQAEAAAQVLHPSGVDAIFVSPLTRTQQTAAPLVALSGLTPVVLDGVREIAAGDYEMATDHDSILGYIGTVADWIEGRLDTRMAGSESGHEFLARYDAAVAGIAADGHQRAVIVSHGAAIRTWVAQRVTGSSAHEKATQGLDNTAAIELEGSPAEGWHVHSWTSEALGGALLDGHQAPDPTGQAIEGDAGHHE